MRTNEEIVTIIENSMKEKELSLSELARRVGMAKSALSRYFNRTREFPLNRLNDFTRVLDLDPKYVLGFEEQEDQTGITKIYNQLSHARQHNVYCYAKEQLSEQNKVIDLGD